MKTTTYTRVCNTCNYATQDLEICSRCHALFVDSAGLSPETLDLIAQRHLMLENACRLFVDSMEMPLSCSRGYQQLMEACDAAKEALAGGTAEWGMSPLAKAWPAFRQWQEEMVRAFKRGAFPEYAIEPVKNDPQMQSLIEHVAEMENRARIAMSAMPNTKQ